MVYQYRLRPDGSSCFPYASDAIFDIFRVSPQDVLEDASQVLAQLHPDDFASAVESIQASARDLSPWQHEYRVISGDGTVRWLLGNAAPEREADGATLWHGFITDITARINVQKQGSLCELALNAISQGVLISTPDGRILSTNAAFMNITGYHEAEILGRRCGFVQGPRTDPDTVAAMRLAQSNAREFVGDVLNYRKDGSTFWNELSISPVFDAAGQLTHFIGITRDITLRKLAEEGLCQYQQNLEEMVAVRTSEVTLALTDSKQARELLLRHQLTLNQATRLAELGAWSIELQDMENFDKNPLNWSLQMYKLMDYTLAELPVPNPAAFFARIHPDERLGVMGHALQALAEKRPWKNEFRVLRQDGRIRLMSELGEYVFDDSGRPIWMYGAVKDITEQRELETRLQESDARLHMALKGAGAGHYEWNRETGVDLWSDEIRKLLGLEFSAAPACYATWRASVHPEDLARIEVIIESAFQRGVDYEVEWRVNLPPDVPPRWLMDRAVPVREADGRLVRYRGIVIDMTQRKLTELALKQHRFHLEEIVNCRTQALTQAEAEQRRLNRALRLLSDCNVAVVYAQSETQLLADICRQVVEVGGYMMAWVGVAQPDSAKTVLPVASFGHGCADYLEQIQVSWDEHQSIGRGLIGSAIRSRTIQVGQSNGRNPRFAHWREAARSQGYQSAAALPLIVNQQVLGVLVLYSAELQAFGGEEVKLLDELVNDLSFGLESLRSRSQLAIYQHQLEQRVAQRTQEIDALNLALIAKARDAEAANQAKSTFLSTMSHELRTPLNAVIGLTGLLADSSLSRRQQDHAEKIQLSARALHVLIDDILDFSRIEAGELQLEQIPFSLSAILRAIAAVLGVGVGHKPIETLFDVGPEVPDAFIGDAMRLQQILLNLTSNAVKFTHAGTIVVAVRCVPRGDGAARAEVLLQFSVRDTGIGIAGEHLGLIFEGFTQAATSISRVYGGSGLGLAISARLVTLMGGKIGVESGVGLGSEFCFEVPLTLGQCPPQCPPPGIPLALSVLIVDDHPLARSVLAQTCHALGWQATAVDSGAAGLQALRSSIAEDRDYDIMLLDWRMPDMDGLAMLHQAYEASDIGLPLVVLMTSMAELEAAAAASEDFNLDGIAAKPLTPRSLVDVVVRAYVGDDGALVPTVAKSDARLTGMRLLVAEDNLLNQEVIEQILSNAGAEVVTVGDGLEAVAALRLDGAHFDAVLMDIQMPLMDGYTATRVIREELGFLTLPIIAVTAFAQPQDREKSRLAGMTGHLVKPLVVSALLDLLVAQRRDSGACPLQQPAVEAPSLAPVIKLAGLDLEAALNAFGGDEQRYLVILRKFMAQHAGDVEEARHRVAVDDHPGAMTVLHGFSGIASFLQANEVGHLGRAAEAALRDGRLHEVPLLFDALETALETVKNSFYQFENLYGSA